MFNQFNLVSQPPPRRRATPSPAQPFATGPITGLAPLGGGGGQQQGGFLAPPATAAQQFQQQLFGGAAGGAFSQLGPSPPGPQPASPGLNVTSALAQSASVPTVSLGPSQIAQMSATAVGRSPTNGPSPSNKARVRALQFDDASRHQLVLKTQQMSTTPRQGRSFLKSYTQVMKSTADVTGGNKALEYAIQVILNVQALDSNLLAKAMLSPNDAGGGLDAASVMQRLTEVGPKLLKGIDRLRYNVSKLDMKGTVSLMKDLGLDDEGIQDEFASSPSLASVQEDIIQVLKGALPAADLSEAVAKVVEKRLRDHLERRGVTRYSEHIVDLRYTDESWASVWERIYLQYPSRPVPGPLAEGCEHRSEIRVLIIGPGFGLLATPHMIDLVRRSGYQLLELPQLPNLEDVWNNPRQLAAAVQLLRDNIARFKPSVICAASKGGLYFNHLWEDPEWSIPCVLINAHPNIKKLAKKAPVVLTQGSRDETFKRILERKTFVVDNEQVRDHLARHVRYTTLRRPGDSPGLVVTEECQVPCTLADGRMSTTTIPKGAVLKHDVSVLNQYDHEYSGFSRLVNMDDIMHLKTPAAISYRHGREDLEDLIRTGAAQKTFLYLSISGITVRPGKPPQCTRMGDAHAAPQSLCMNQCLPRLIDAAVSGRPEDALHETWQLLTPEERKAGENYLGHDPQGLKRFWTGGPAPGGTGVRVKVTPDSDEWFAVQQIFDSNPEEKAYEFGHDWGKQIINIDRVQSAGQLEAADSHYLSVQKSLGAQGTQFMNGVHARWLFHGSSAIDSIVSDSLNGFKVTLSKTTMWGAGIYLARDAQYPDDHGFFGQPRADGSKDMLLCLATTGMSILGDEAYAIKPYRAGTTQRYNSCVDSLSNPEIFVVNDSSALYPAYVITYI